MTGGEPTDTVAYVAVGSNIVPRRNIPRAFRALARIVTITATSTFYQTPPLERPDQAPFFNGVWQVLTDLEPRTLKFQVLRAIELHLGRVRTEDAHAARTIDLDLVLYGDETIDEGDLVVPDPDIHTRPFIAAPLVEIAPTLVVPGDLVTLADLEVARITADMEADGPMTDNLKRWVTP